MNAITEMCNNFDEVIKGQSNRELLSDFNNLLASAVTLTLGREVGGAAKPKKCTGYADDGRVRRDRSRDDPREEARGHPTGEEKTEAMLEPDKFEGIVAYMPEDRKVVRIWLTARVNAREQHEEERRASNKAPSMVFSSQNLPEVPSDGKDHEPKVRLLQDLSTRCCKQFEHYRTHQPRVLLQS